MSQEPLELLESVLSLAIRAGARIMTVYQSPFEVEKKADDSPLTQADIASHNTILSGLRELTPEIPILSEESAESVGKERRGWPLFWLVDPLDGTKEFVQRNGEFTVNIALVRDHEAVMGVVHVPAQGLSYFGSRARGAYRQSSGSNPVAIKTAKLGKGPVRVVGSRSHRGTSLDPFLARLGSHELLAMGSSLKFCLVAEGSADVYPRFGPTSEWDTAAAHAVVECAGGRVVDLNGEPLRYNTKDELLNPHFLVYGDSGHDWLAYV